MARRRTGEPLRHGTGQYRFIRVGLQFSASGQFVGSLGASEELNSVTAGPDGKFYVLQNVLGSGGVSRFTAAGAGETLVPVDYNSNFTVPLGLAFDPAGQLYVGSNTIFMRDPTVYRVGSSGLTSVVGVSGNYLLRDIEFDSTGNLFVAMDGLGIRGYAGTGPSTTFTIPVATHDFDFGPDGKLYVATASQGVLMFDPTTGAALGTFVPASSQGLVDADDMVFGGDGILYVNSPGAKKILKFDSITGAPLGTFATYGEGRGVYITSMAYTEQPLPEPNTGLGVALGAAWVGRRARRAKSQRREMICGSERARGKTVDRPQQWKGDER